MPTLYDWEWPRGVRRHSRTGPSYNLLFKATEILGIFGKPPLFGINPYLAKAAGEAILELRSSPRPAPRRQVLWIRRTEDRIGEQMMEGERRDFP